MSSIFVFSGGYSERKRSLQSFGVFQATHIGCGKIFRMYPIDRCGEEIMVILIVSHEQSKVIRVLNFLVSIRSDACYACYHFRHM